jgi:hypothetical protein
VTREIADLADRTAGVAIGDALEHLAPRDLEFWIVPDLNRDGVAARISRVASPDRSNHGEQAAADAGGRRRAAGKAGSARRVPVIGCPVCLRGELADEPQLTLR